MEKGKVGNFQLSLALVGEKLTDGDDGQTWAPSAPETIQLGLETLGFDKLPHSSARGWSLSVCASSAQNSELV